MWNNFRKSVRSTYYKNWSIWPLCTWPSSPRDIISWRQLKRKYSRLKTQPWLVVVDLEASLSLFRCGFVHYELIYLQFNNKFGTNDCYKVGTTTWRIVYYLRCYDFWGHFPAIFYHQRKFKLEFIKYKVITLTIGPQHEVSFSTVYKFSLIFSVFSIAPCGLRSI